MEQSWLKMKVDAGCSCEKCGSKERLTVDHIIPVMLMEQMGLFQKEFYDDENFSVLCKKCNFYKGHRLDFANPKTAILMKKYVAML